MTTLGTLKPMASRATLSLNGRLVCEDGIFVVTVDGPNWVTYAETMDKALNDVPPMIEQTLHAYAQKGALEQYLTRLGVPTDVELLDVTISIDMSAIVSASRGMVECVTVPLKAA